MKLRDKIDQIDGRLDMLNKSVWFVMKRMGVEPSEILEADASYKRESEIASLKEKAKRLGVKPVDLV